MFLRPSAAWMRLAAAIGTVLVAGSSTARAVQIYETYYVPTERVVVSSPLVATSYVPTTTILSPTRYVYETTSSILAPTGYRVQANYGLLGRLRSYDVSPTYYAPTSYVVSRPTYLAPTRYVVSRPTYLAPTTYITTPRVYERRYVVPSEYIVEDYVAPSSRVIYDDSVIYESEPVAPSTSRPAPQPAPRRQGQVDAEPELSLDGTQTQATGAQNPPSNRAIESTPLGAESNLPVPPANNDLPVPQPEEPVNPEPVAPEIPTPPLDQDIQRSESFRPVFPTSPAVTATRLVNAVQGFVKDNQTGRPESAVQVVFKDVKNRFQDRVATTDSTGRFVVSNIPDGDYAITVEDVNRALASRQYGVVTVSSGRLFDRTGQPHGRLVLNY